jgi:hypothetical protein
MVTCTCCRKCQKEHDDVTYNVNVDIGMLLAACFIVINACAMGVICR